MPAARSSQLHIIGDGTVIGTGSAVTKDVPARSLAVGNPARVIHSL